MDYREKVRQCKLENPDWGRRRIAQELGISEKRVRMVLESMRTTRENGIRSIRHLNEQSIIDAVVHLKDVNDRDEILRACKLDPAEWDCVDALIKAWQMGSKDSAGKPQVTDLYSVSVKAKPKKNGFDLDACLEKIKRMEPVEILPNRIPGRGLLEVFLSDAHFGLDNNYTGLLEEIVERCKAVEEVVIIIGSDGLHVDNVNNTTLKGTVLEEIDLNDAWEQMYELYFNLIYQCLRMGKRTLVKYLRGNHDATSGFLFAKTLEKVLPDAEYDLSLEQYKAHRFGNVGIGWTHGDKGKRNEYDKLFYRRFPWIFADASRCEIHYGHIHQETVKDSYATKIRSVPTATAQSGYTIDNGYESAQEFQLFEYSEDKLKTIHYI